MPREIELFVNHPRLALQESEVISLIENAVEFLGEKFPPGDVSVAILTDKQLAELHEDFLDDPTVTDVITFPGDPEMEFAGEVCVSLDRALEVCAHHHSTLDHELSLYICHGLLHLAGYNDKTGSEIAAMRAGEHDIMQHLVAENCIPSFEMEGPA